MTPQDGWAWFGKDGLGRSHLLREANGAFFLTLVGATIGIDHNGTARCGYRAGVDQPNYPKPWERNHPAPPCKVCSSMEKGGNLYDRLARQHDAWILELRRDGFTYRRIGEIVGLSALRVSHIYQRAEIEIGGRHLKLVGNKYVPVEPGQ